MATVKSEQYDFFHEGFVTLPRYLLMLWKEMPSFIATLSLKLRGIEEYDNLTFQTEPSVN